MIVCHSLTFNDDLAIDMSVHDSNKNNIYHLLLNEANILESDEKRELLKRVIERAGNVSNILNEGNDDEEDLNNNNESDENQNNGATFNPYNSGYNNSNIRDDDDDDDDSGEDEDTGIFSNNQYNYNTYNNFNSGYNNNSETSSDDSDVPLRKRTNHSLMTPSQRRMVVARKSRSFARQPA